LTVIFFHSFGVLEISSGLPQILDPPLAASCAKVSLLSTSMTYGGSRAL
jgi:hypothetical protein